MKKFTLLKKKKNMKGKAKNSLLLLFYFCNKSELDKKIVEYLRLDRKQPENYLP